MKPTERMKEAVLNSLWRLAREEMKKYALILKVDLRKLAEANLDLSKLILKKYSDQVTKYGEKLRKLGVVVGEKELNQATIEIVKFLKQEGLSVDEVVVKWIKENLRKITRIAGLLKT